MKFNENKRWKVNLYSINGCLEWEFIMTHEEWQDFNTSITSHWPIEIIISDKKRLYIQREHISHYTIEEL